jgi:sugar phosphate isomerase/epimerase
VGVQLALCNEVLQPLPFARQCEFAARVGYDALEIAPYTLADEPHRMTAAHRAEVRRAAADAGLRIAGLHWLLVAPKGLSITSSDAAVRARTVDVMLRLADLCADLGARYLVHGSPAQRAVPEGESAATALARATECWAQAGRRAASLGVAYCIEPLARTETALVNTVAEAAAIVATVGSPGLRTMIDCSAASLAEAEPIPALIDRWLPTGRIAHVQVNDANRRGPGEGEVKFAPILAALARHGYDGYVAVEPFRYEPDGPATAARAAGYLRGILETLDAREA